MKILSKLFEDSVTAWRYNEFFKARIQLTLVYVLVIAVILSLFSSVLFFAVDQQFVVDVHEPELFEKVHQVSPDAFLEEFAENLIVIDFLILSIFSFLGYFLAGKTLRPIEIMFREHEEFSGNVAHELRTPLAALYASTSATLRENATVEEYKETLQDVKSEAKRLIGLTERLLETTRTRKLLVDSVELDTLVKAVASKMQSLANERGIHIHTKLESMQVMGDPVKLEALFFNLIHNAIKFSHEGGIVDVTLAKNTVTVTDYGIGISKDALEHIFERFYTTNEARNEQHACGTGLGLAIVSKIAEEHHARVTAESELGKGTSIAVVFN